MLRARGQRAVSLGAMSRAQARALYAEQTASLPAFMAHTYRTAAEQVSFLCRRTENQGAEHRAPLVFVRWKPGC